MLELRRARVAPAETVGAGTVAMLVEMVIFRAIAVNIASAHSNYRLM
jgi:hypothetical protein